MTAPTRAGSGRLRSLPLLYIRRPGPAAALAFVAMILTSTSLSTASAHARWPSPGGDERAALSLPLTDGRFFGANDDFERERGQRVLGAISEAGANIARRTLSWWHTEPERDVWAEASWAAAGRFHEGALARGLTPIHILGFAPPWARKRGERKCVVVGLCEYPPRRRMIGEWAEFAAEAARRFPSAVFEIWNEPNLRDFWQPAPNPELWAELVVAASTAIRAVDPEAIVIGCACAGVTKGDRAAEMPTAEFLDRAYENEVSIRGRLDGISVHLFPQTEHLEGGVKRALRFGRHSMLAAQLDAVRTAAAEHGEVPAPVWITEAGYWTRSNAYPATELTEAQVAEAFSRLARRVFSAPGIRALLIHRAKDTGGIDRSEFGTREASFGLLEPGRELRPKPSFCVFAGLAGNYGYPGCEAKAGPAVRIRSAPSGATRPHVVRLRIAAPVETTMVQCRAGGVSYAHCPTGVDVDSTKPGLYRVRARGLDAAGHAGVVAKARWFVPR